MKVGEAWVSSVDEILKARTDPPSITAAEERSDDLVAMPVYMEVRAGKAAGLLPHEVVAEERLSLAGRQNGVVALVDREKTPIRVPHAPIRNLEIEQRSIVDQEGKPLLGNLAHCDVAFAIIEQRAKRLPLDTGERAEDGRTQIRDEGANLVTRSRGVAEVVKVSNLVERSLFVGC